MLGAVLVCVACLALEVVEGLQKVVQQAVQHFVLEVVSGSPLLDDFLKQIVSCC